MFFGASNKQSTEIIAAEKQIAAHVANDDDDDEYRWPPKKQLTFIFAWTL